MPKREFVMLAKSYKDKDYIAEWFVSEKLDGMRVWWDGGISRGVPKIDVPWANNSKDSRYKEAPTSTGLWTRYGNVVHAPDCWLDQLPKISLDGELYTPGHRQHMMSTAKKLIPDVKAWESINLHVFDTPSYESILQSGVIKGTNSHQYWTKESIDSFMRHRFNILSHVTNPTSPLKTRLGILKRFVTDGVAVIHPQSQLASINATAKEQAFKMLEDVVNDGGEGLILRAPFSLWEPHRVNSMLKVKPFDDMEVKVIGYITGKGKHEGRMGSLIVECSYGHFAVSGFTDAERELSRDRSKHAIENPGVKCLGFTTKRFNIGDIVTIKYRGLSADKIPQEARYWRKREDV